MFHILVVDDDKNTRRLMEAVLTAENYTVFTAENGEEALKVMEKEHIDLVILDIMMPKMNGYEFTKVLRESNNNLPILMIRAKISYGIRSGQGIGSVCRQADPGNHHDLPDIPLSIHSVAGHPVRCERADHVSDGISDHEVRAQRQQRQMVREGLHGDHPGRRDHAHSVPSAGHFLGQMHRRDRRGSHCPVASALHPVLQAGMAIKACPDAD